LYPQYNAGLNLTKARDAEIYKAHFDFKKKQIHLLFNSKSVGSGSFFFKGSNLVLNADLSINIHTLRKLLLHLD